jgi:pyruvate dehydrogenase E1 component
MEDQRRPSRSEAAEWIEAFDDLRGREGAEGAADVLRELLRHARSALPPLDADLTTPYVNTIPAAEEPAYPGDEAIERRIRSIIRWNAAVMVLRANKRVEGLGGHLATYASCATLFEVGFNHFFQARRDQVFFQGHASPGIYARAFLEGRLDEAQLDRFRQETGGDGLSSYPHPWLMPGFWEFPTVSMGLSPLSAVYQARFNRYLRDRGIRDTGDGRVWCFIGDGEIDEPESTAALGLAAREGLDNLIFVVNCNLQRLDGPVRGNGKIIQELEGLFRGAGWNVLKVLWGREWDPLLEADVDGLLARRMEEAVDGEYQKYSVETGAYIRERFFGTDPRLKKLVESLSDGQLRALRRGGHDVRKVHAAYRRAAREPNGRPTVVLAKTVKGWTLGDAIEGRNAAHQLKSFTAAELRIFRDRLGLAVSDDQLAHPPYFKPPADSPEMAYLRERRESLGGPVPKRVFAAPREEAPPLALFADLLRGTSQEISTTKAFARLLGTLMKDATVGRRVVPIVPDEAMTFGLNALFRPFGIYSPKGQRYEPVDREMLISYREARDGQILEEGITEAGATASFTAAGTSAATHGVTMLPFYAFYSMFGYQRVGDLLWAAADARARGFLLGCTAGRTTLSGEGLQHEDGHSPLLFSGLPAARWYDPAWACELAVIVQDGLRRLLAGEEPCLYYLTLYNEPYAQPPLPADREEDLLRGLYLFRKAPGAEVRAQILGSGALLREALRAQEILAERYGTAADVWSVPSWLELRRDALKAERWNRLHPDEPPRVPHVVRMLGAAPGPVIAVTDYMRAVPEMIARWLPGRLWPLGTDGFGRSDSRPALRRHFEMDAEHVAYEALLRLDAPALAAARKDLGIDPDRPDPAAA